MSESLRKVEAEGAKPRAVKHGIYAYLDGGKLPSGRVWKRELAKLNRTREDLILEFGGERIKPSVRALVESAMEALTIQRLSLLYIKRGGIIRRDSLRKGNLQLHDVLSGQFISYGNAVRLNLEAAARMATMKDLVDPLRADLIIVGSAEDVDERERAQDERAEEPEDQAQETPPGETPGETPSTPGKEAPPLPQEPRTPAPPMDDLGPHQGSAGEELVEERAGDGPHEREE
jgi:hypothetical protein